MALDTEVEICNAALLRAGITRRIENLSDSTTEADACEAEYYAIRDFLLEEHNWQFCIRYTTLAADTETPEWYWDYQYTLPNDFVTMLHLEEEHIKYEITDDQKLMTNEEAPLKIRYVSKETDPTRWPQLFKQALVSKLAAVLAMALTKDIKRVDYLEQRYDRYLADARFQDSARRSYQPLDSTDFHTARIVGPEAIDVEGDLN